LATAQSCCGLKAPLKTGLSQVARGHLESFREPHRPK
jgi:hypothetical protein